MMTTDHSTAAAPLPLGDARSNAETFQRIWVSSRPFGDVVTALRQAIDAAGMKVLHEIDPQLALAGFGHAIGGARLVFFFHPELLARLLQMDWTAVVDAPLKLAVMELPDGTVSVRMADLAATFARYGSPVLTDFGHELAQTCDRIVSGSV